MFQLRMEILKNWSIRDAFRFWVAMSVLCTWLVISMPNAWEVRVVIVWEHVWRWCWRCKTSGHVPGSQSVESLEQAVSAALQELNHVRSFHVQLWYLHVSFVDLFLKFLFWWQFFSTWVFLQHVIICGNIFIFIRTYITSRKLCFLLQEISFVKNVAIVNEKRKGML